MPFWRYFISGLKPHIKREVQALQPLNLTKAIAFAKLWEDKYLDLKGFSRLSLTPNSHPTNQKNTQIFPNLNKPALLPKPLTLYQ